MKKALLFILSLALFSCQLKQKEPCNIDNLLLGVHDSLPTVHLREGMSSFNVVDSLLSMNKIDSKANAVYFNLHFMDSLSVGCYAYPFGGPLYCGASLNVCMNKNGDCLFDYDFPIEPTKNMRSRMFDHLINDRVNTFRKKVIWDRNAPIDSLQKMIIGIRQGILDYGYQLMKNDSISLCDVSKDEQDKWLRERRIRFYFNARDLSPEPPPNY